MIDTGLRFCYVKVGSSLILSSIRNWQYWKNKLSCSYDTSLLLDNREIKQREWRLQQEWQKINRFRLAKQLWMLFWTFLCHHCMTMTWNCLISCFVEAVNTRQWPSFSFSELWCSPLEFIFRKICQHYLMNWTWWNTPN